MAIAFVNATSGGTGDSTSYTTLNMTALNCTTGNLIVVGVRATIPTSITDTAGNTYVKITDFSASGIGDVSIWYAKNITGNASNVISVNFSGSSQFIEAIASQYSGADTSSPLDIFGTKAAASATSVTSDSFSTNFANEVIVGFGTQASTGRTFTPGASYTERVDGSSAALQDQIVSAIQSSVTMSMTSNASASWGLIFASFKEASPFVLQADVGTYTLTGQNANTLKGFKVIADLGTYTLTGIAATLSKGFGMIASAGTYTLTGIDAGLRTARIMAAALGTYTLTGIDATFKRGFGIVAGVGSYILTGIAATLRSSNIWSNQTKNSSTWTNNTKNSSTFTNQTKNSSTWTNQNKS